MFLLSFLTPLFSQVLRDGKEVQVPVPTVVAGDIAACLDMASMEDMGGPLGAGCTQKWHHPNGVIPQSFQKGYFPIARTMKGHSHELIALHPRLTTKVVLGTGDVVPADLRLFEAKDFKVSEMALTGAILGCQTVKMVKQCKTSNSKEPCGVSCATVRFGGR